MIRYTVHDAEKTVSFHDRPELAARLVAGCASNPSLLEELLLATEPLYPGVVTRVMHELLAADAGLESGVDPLLFDAFEVADEATARRAQRPSRDGLVAIDLVEHSIGGTAWTSEPLQARGSVHTWLDEAQLERETVYALGSSWTVHVRQEAAAGVDAHA